MLADLVTSRVRRNIIELLASKPREIFYVREITRKTGEQINSVRRELAYLEKKGVIKKEQRLNKLFYCLRRDYPFYFELMGIAGKTSGLGRDILRNRQKLGRIKFAMLSGKLIRGREIKPDEIDFLIIGKVVLPELARLIKKEEARRGREINYTIMEEKEFNFRKKRRDPFILKILKGSKIMIIGDEEELI